MQKIRSTQGYEILTWKTLQREGKIIMDVSQQNLTISGEDTNSGDLQLIDLFQAVAYKMYYNGGDLI